MYRISIIGSGRVGWQLAQALENNEHCIEEVWSRHPGNAADLVGHLYNARVQEHLDFSESRAQIFLLAVADKAIEEVVDQLMLPPNAILAHTSGTLPMELLQPACERYGVFYPLQTFSKERNLVMEDVPLCLEAVDKKTLKHLKRVAGSISRQAIEISAPKRKVLHMAAVFACNFTNHMLRISEEILENHQIESNILHPLISETLEKSLEIGAEKAQTGPASRQDMQVLAHHLEQLEQQPEWAELYYLISEDIIRHKK